MGSNRILVIEDEHLLRKAFEFLLSSEGYEVKSAQDGKHALDQLKKYKPDLILLDMLMPVMNGMEFLEEAKLPETLPGCKVIVLSNLSDTVPLRRVKKYNVSKVLLKSNLAPAELVSEVRKQYPE